MLSFKPTKPCVVQRMLKVSEFHLDFITKADPVVWLIQSAIKKKEITSRTYSSVLFAKATETEEISIPLWLSGCLSKSDSENGFIFVVVVVVWKLLHSWLLPLKDMNAYIQTNTRSRLSIAQCNYAFISLTNVLQCELKRIQSQGS